MSAGAPPNWRLNPRTWDDLVRRLTWQYGRARAEEIMDGTDEAASADLDAWDQIGRERG